MPRQREILREHWPMPEEKLLKKFPDAAEASVALGARLHGMA
ncbi:hypothetical protein [Rhizobium sp. P38BS-XIX]|nr:hypothetical protein [Rhizobium sp. P38BS-XIX]